MITPTTSGKPIMPLSVPETKFNRVTMPTGMRGGRSSPVIFGGPALECEVGEGVRLLILIFRLNQSTY